MNETPDLSEVRRKTVRLLTFEDGLWDLLMGIVILMLAAYPVTRAGLGPEWNAGLFLTLLALFTAAYLYLRRIIASPRVGYAKTRMTPAVRTILVVTIALVLLTFALFILTLMGSESTTTDAPTTSGSRSYLVDVVVLIVMVVLFSGIARAFHVPRIYAYGWLFGGGNLLSVILNRNAPERFNLPLGIAGAVIVLIGVYLFTRFLHRYPEIRHEAFRMEA
jgi:hypothetical protein